MRLDQAQHFIESIERSIVRYADKQQWPLETYQPLVDELVRLRLSYRRYRYGLPSDDKEITEDELALELLRNALAIVYSLAVLPAAMIAQMKRGVLSDLQPTQKARPKTRKSVKDKEVQQSGQAVTTMTLADIDSRSIEELHNQLLDFFTELLREAAGYVYSVDGEQTAQRFREMLSENFGEV